MYNIRMVHITFSKRNEEEDRRRHGSDYNQEHTIRQSILSHPSLLLKIYFRVIRQCSVSLKRSDVSTSNLVVILSGVIGLVFQLPSCWLHNNSGSRCWLSVLYYKSDMTTMVYKKILAAKCNECSIKTSNYFLSGFWEKRSWNRSLNTRLKMSCPLKSYFSCIIILKCKSISNY